MLIRMADNLRMATLLPAAAIRPIRPAELVREVRIEEKVSDYFWGGGGGVPRHLVSFEISSQARKR